LFAALGINLRRRIVFLFFLTLLINLSLVGRLGWLQFVRGEELRSGALELRMRKVPVEARRGIIYDRNGRELALSINVESVYATPLQVKNPEETARKLAEILEMKPEDILERLQRSSAFEWIKRKIDNEKAKKVRALGLKGIYLTMESQRFYPKKNLASHVLGIAGIDSQGLEGLEVVYDQELRGTPGSIIVEYDARGREMPQAVQRYIPPVDGNNLVLTIDEVIQYIAERDLEKAMVSTQAKQGSVIVLDPKTGEVLALANRPDYDPNRYNDYPAKDRRNFSISDTYPPGSTFKVITAAAALEEGVTSLEDRYYCSGEIKVGSETIHCWKSDGHGSESFLEVIQNSCNIGFVNAGLRLGKDKFYKYVEAFGLTKPTGIDLPGEAKGIMLPPERMKTIDLAVMSFGQTLTVTPIQLVTAVAAVANGGVLMQPHLVKEIRRPDGSLVRSIPPTEVRRVLSPQTAKDLRQAMEQVVVKGTGKAAYLPGYSVAGKTGTAQKVIGRTIAPGKYIASFVGFAPADDPKVAVLVVLDEPVGNYYGGQIAAPLFASVVEDVLHYLEVPTRELPPPKGSDSSAGKKEAEVTVPNIVNLTVEQAQKQLAEQGLGLEVTGDGPVILYQTPAAGSRVKAGTKVVGHRESGKLAPDTVTVPDLTGKTIAEAAEILARMGLRLNVKGTGLAKTQQPSPGSRVPKGSLIDVTFEPIKPP